MDALLLNLEVFSFPFSYCIMGGPFERDHSKSQQPFEEPTLATAEDTHENVESTQAPDCLKGNKSKLLNILV